MIIKLAYGKTGLEIDLPDDWNVTVIEPTFLPGLPDQKEALKEALCNPIESPPLSDLVKPGAKVGVVFSDITRPAPNHLLVPAVIDALAHISGIDITLFNALGTHRPNTDRELRGMLGDEMVDRFRIVQNDAFDQSTQTQLGNTARGHEVWLNREFLDCDIKILTGFIEPHFFAGFSGGYKAIMPGMAGQGTVLRNHDAVMVSDPRANWGTTEGNPMWGEIREIGKKAEPDFLLNVTLNRDKQITAVFAGDVDAAHAAGSSFAKKTAMVPVRYPFDLVITTNSGYPLDLNLYQAVKGMSAATQVVKDGGVIIVAADCWDGIPDHGLYGQLLREADSPQAVIDMVGEPGFLKQDQWQAQVQAQIQLKANVHVHTHNLTPEQIEAALLTHSPNVEVTARELMAQLGPGARVCVLPEGPQTIPYISSD